ncbi:MAG TPA: AarF/UbiB family protein [Candidatus Sulfopaludibacter sp.]|nr:AarF/UbiB family protein [Candidatus Sulfopaludibacter sp.]
MALPAGAAPEQRLLLLISRMPGLQKLGQVLARNRRLSPALREALEELENGMSDAQPGEIRDIVRRELGARLEAHRVEIASAILKEGSAAAILPFTWQNPGGERERGVFKVLKPYVPSFFAEDMDLLQKLGEYLSSPERGYQFAVRDLREMIAEVRMLLEHELEFTREQATLVEAARGYRASIGIRVPRLIPQLCSPCVTAMSEETGVKVTDACRRSPIRRQRIARQLIEALLAVPLLSRADVAVFHADPHAGNLLYDEPNRELVMLDWALAERLNLESRRYLVLLALMMVLRNREGVLEAALALGRSKKRHVISRAVDRFFHEMSPLHRPGVLDAMRLLDNLALEGVHFPAPLFLFRKIVFTLDGVLHDVEESEVRIEEVIVREYLTRCAASLGVFHEPLTVRDLTWRLVRALLTAR